MHDDGIHNKRFGWFLGTTDEERRRIEHFLEEVVINKTPPEKIVYDGV